MLARLRETAQARQVPSHLVMVLEYTNHRGERGHRRVIPQRVWFGSTTWHPDEQWLLEAYDVDRGAQRDFAMELIHAMWAEPKGDMHVLDRSGDSSAPRRLPV